MPKLWTETIEAHRHDVREAILDATASLVVEHGLLSVTMSWIAKETGIGRATLYKYFPDVESILLAWHQREIGAHMHHLAEVRDHAGGPAEGLAAVLEAYAFISHETRRQHDSELTALLHGDRHIASAERKLRRMIRDLLSEAAKTGDIRDDVPADELSVYCLHALAAASSLPSKASVRRLVATTLDGLCGPSSS